jgi:hypothetical protein
MSCYLRHMEDVLHEAGVELTSSNRKTVDAIIKGLSGQKNCSAAWKQVKGVLADPRSRQDLIGSLRERWQAEGMRNRE